ncbi:MAG: oxygenase MpaB family protein [Knoellia sp.]
MTSRVAVPAATSLPSRHREAEVRGERLARPLRLMTRQFGSVDETLMDRLGESLLERDELAARLVAAMRLAATDPAKVTHSQLQTALASGVEAMRDAPPALVEFFAAVNTTPDWVDWELVERGALVFDRLGANSGDILLALSLIGGYRFGGPTELLAATGALTGDSTQRRLAETQSWVLGLMQPGALRPGAEGWRQTVHVRVMHALVNANFEDGWDVDRIGLPINQSDQAGTLGLFDGALLVGCRSLGVPISRADAHAVMHLWKYTGWLMGVDADFLTDDEDVRHRLNLHILVSAPDQTQAGRDLARATVATQCTRKYGHRSERLNRWRGEYEYERLLSMLTVMLGPRSMRDLGLPIRPPWAYAARLATNTWRYRVTGRGVRGRTRLERQGKATQWRDHATYLQVGVEDGVADLPDAPARHASPTRARGEQDPCT